MTQNTLNDEIDKIIHDEANLSLQPLLYLASDEKLDNWNEAAAGVYRQVYKICRSIAEKTVEAMRVEGCRFGCYCALCALCDEDTHIHCSDCLMTKPISAITEQSKKAKEWLGKDGV